MQEEDGERPPHTLPNLHRFRAGSPYRGSAGTQALAVEPSAVPSRHFFKVCSSAKVYYLIGDILFLWIVTRMTSERAQSSKTGNSIGVTNQQGMRNLLCPKTPPFTKARGLLELHEGRRGTLHTVPSECGIRTKHHMGERPTQLTFREPDHSGQSTSFCQVSPRESPPSVKWMSLESIQSMECR